MREKGSKSTPSLPIRSRSFSGEGGKALIIFSFSCKSLFRHIHFPQAEINQYPVNLQAWMGLKTTHSGGRLASF